MTRAILVSAPASGAGKSTVALGLMGALKKRGQVVAPFKSGPDFIDPGLHALACGRPSRNLDTWMMDEARILAGLSIGCAGADVAVVEGAMGLFDGAAGATQEGSAADLARRFGIPVLLVVDASGMAGSVAAIVHGFATLDPDVTVAGVVFNRVASANHLAHLTEAVEKRTGVRVLGHLMRDDGLTIPERHLGLTTASDLADREVLGRVAERVAEGVDLDAVLSLAAPVRLPGVPGAPPDAPARARLAVARDAAFCFCYPDNLEALARAGAEIVFFSPLTDADLPDGINGIYLPGGYPELHAAALADNAGLRGKILSAGEAGMPILAECGGLIYLSESVTTAEGDSFPMCALLPAACRMESRRVALGYREVAVTKDNLLGLAGSRLRGHEFHYSSVDRGALDAAGIDHVLTLARRGGRGERTEGYRRGHTVATYAHLMLSDSAAAHWVDTLVRSQSEAS